jgi:1,4-dihydroxy-6-naphthoate synthase
MSAGVPPLSLAYSPCPNDTFIFAAWTRGLLADAPPVEVVLDDVESLNAAALEARYALTKASYGAIPSLTHAYRVLRSGGALGRGCGPLLVANPGSGWASSGLGGLPRTARIAIPGRMTTAYLLLRLALGWEPDVATMRFDRIVEAVARGDADAGLIIHESRFTYGAAGLACVADLGAWWEQETGLPIPLGAILARRDLGDADVRAIDRAIRASLAFAYTDGARVAPYVREHAFEMDEDVMRAHIDLYVNAFTRDVGDEGVAAVDALFERAARAGLLANGARAEFA